MKKLLDSIVSFILEHIEALIVGLIALVFGAISGGGFARKHYEKKLMKTKEALRKCYAEMSALDANEKRNARKIQQYQAQIDKYQEVIQDLEKKLSRT